MDWRTEETVEALLAEAEELTSQKKLYAARDKYNQVLELDGSLVEAKEGRDSTEQGIETFEEKQAYVDQIGLYDLSAKYIDTYLDGRIPGVRFKLRNKGDRPSVPM